MDSFLQMSDMLLIERSLPTLRKFPAKSHLAPRGGHRNHIGYGNTDIEAEHFHFVVKIGEFGVLYSYLYLDFPKRLQNAFLRIASHVYQVASTYPVLLEGGEICVRAIFYPRQAKRFNSGLHMDFCYLSVPVYDSLKLGFLPASGAFYGEMAARFTDLYGKYKKPKCHSFKSSEQMNRLYIVGFVQLPFNSIDKVTSESYNDVLSNLCNTYNTYETHKY
jgi:hypothetical protein